MDEVVEYEQHWWLGSMNDGLFVINQQPRPSTDDQFHEREDGPSFVECVATLDAKRAQALVDEHNRIVDALLAELSLLRSSRDEPVAWVSSGTIVSVAENAEIMAHMAKHQIMTSAVPLYARPSSPPHGWPTREKLGELIYRALYEHKGGLWHAVEPVHVWYEMADRLIALLSSAPEVKL
jgi:hypothetical protein